MKSNKPMSKYSRIIVETDKDKPEKIAEVIAGNFNVANGFRVRIKPVYDEDFEISNDPVYMYPVYKGDKHQWELAYDKQGDNYGQSK